MGLTQRHKFPETGAQGSLPLIVATPTAPRTTAGITTAATRAIPTTAAARFLRARFVHLKLPAIHIEPIELTNGLSCVAAITQLDKAEASRASRFPVGNDSSRRHLIALIDEQLLKGFIVHAEREIANI